jgi:hypothetical protein
VLNIDDPPSDVIHDDELFSKTVQIDKNAGSDEAAESNDAIDVEITLPIEGNNADESHASPVATHAIESSIPTEANEVDHSNAGEDADGKYSSKDVTSNNKIYLMTILHAVNQFVVETSSMIMIQLVCLETLWH